MRTRDRDKSYTHTCAHSVCAGEGGKLLQTIASEAVKDPGGGDDKGAARVGAAVLLAARALGDEVRHVRHVVLREDAAELRDGAAQRGALGGRELRAAHDAAQQRAHRERRRVREEAPRRARAVEPLARHALAEALAPRDRVLVRPHARAHQVRRLLRQVPVKHAAQLRHRARQLAPLVAPEPRAAHHNPSCRCTRHCCCCCCCCSRLVVLAINTRAVLHSVTRLHMNAQ